MSQRESSWDAGLEYAVLTDIGMRRMNNQDAHTVVLASSQDAWRDRGHFFMVADGMGAHAAGELASKLAVDGVPHLYHKYVELSAPEALQKALVETNHEVHRRGQANNDFRNMGTTASALVLLPQGALIGHIGDSRVYRLHAGQLEQLTFDHSLVWELRAAGQLKDDPGLSQAIPKNVITRSLGPNPSVNADIEGPLPVAPGDTFLLCSDGLTGKIEDAELASILAHLSTDDAAQLLVDLANLRGGPDNITVILAKAVADDLVTDASQQPPIRIGGRTDRARVPVVVWVVLSVCLLIAVVLGLTDRWLPAVIAAALGLFSYLVGLLISLRAHSQGTFLGHGRRLGKGPYTATSCPPQENAVELLSSITRNLREANAAGLPLDWGPFDAARETAQQAVAQGDSAGALHQYASAIHRLMEQVRQQQANRDGGPIDDF